MCLLKERYRSRQLSRWKQPPVLLVLLNFLAAGLWGGPGYDSDLAGLAWLAGHWISSADGPVSEEIWLEPLGGMMLGINRQATSSGRVFFEYLRIESSPQGINYIASPLGRLETRFPLKELDGRKAVFENLQHDFPRRILYWIDGDGLLHARVEGEEPGESAQEWSWKRKEGGGPLAR